MKLNQMVYLNFVDNQVGANDFPLSETQFFASCSDEDLIHLERMRTVLHLEGNRSLQLSLNAQPGFFYVHSGYCKLIQESGGRGHSIRIIGPNDIIGYGRWFSEHSKYSCITMSRMTVSFFPKSDFTALQTFSKQLANLMLNWIVKILEQQEAQITTLRKTSARQRVAATLSQLNRRFEKPIGGSDPRTNATIDRKTMAELAGVVIEVLSRVLNELESQNIITRQGRSIVIKDSVALSDAAGE